MENVVKGVAMASTLMMFAYEGYGCIGPSMLPTLVSKDFVLVDHFTHRYLHRPYKTGDVIVAISPTNPEIYISKRILGMAGDIIYKDPLDSRKERIKIPPGHVWLAGDNRSDSTDSRYYGPVPIGLLKGTFTYELPLIQGRILFRFWPTVERIRNGFEQTEIMLGSLNK